MLFLLINLAIGIYRHPRSGQARSVVQVRLQPPRDVPLSLNVKTLVGYRARFTIIITNMNHFLQLIRRFPGVLILQHELSSI